MIASDHGRSHRSIVLRLRERLRYGLLTQELIDRLAMAGVFYYPYYVTIDSEVHLRPSSPQPAGAEVRELDASEASLIADVPGRRLPVENVRQRLQRCTCFGVFVDGGKLAGYTWAEFDFVPTAVGRGVLFELGDHGAYISGMYVTRAYRGRRLAQWLRERVHHALVAAGRDQIYSLTLAYNRSARKFKTRFGAVEIEKRLTYGYQPVFVRDIHLERLTRDPLRTPELVKLGSRRWTNAE